MMKPQRDVLIVVDVQVGFVNHHSEHVVSGIAEFIRAWLRTEQPVILTRFINEPNSQWERLIHWTRLREAPETDLHPSIAKILRENPHSSHVIDKRSYTSLIEPVRELLESLGSSRVVLCGIATDGCVLKTAIDAFEAGFTPIVLKDLCASHAGPRIHEAGLTLLGRFIGKDQIIASSEWLLGETAPSVP